MSIAPPPNDLILAAASRPPTLHADLLAGASPDELSAVLPLLLAAISTMRNRDVLRAVVSALRHHLRASRALRARFLLHTAHPAFAAFWQIERRAVGSLDRAAPDGDDGEVEQDAALDGADGDDDLDCIDVAEYGVEEETPDGEEADPFEEQTTEAAVAAAEEAGEDEEVARAVSRPVRQVVVSLSMDDLDDASTAFWSEGVHDDSVGEGDRFDIASIVNPLTRPLAAQHDGLGDGVVLRKVFSSIARPVIVQVLGSGEDGDEESVVPPGLLIKKGDNLMYDLGVQTIFQLLNVIWQDDSDLLFRFGKPPVAVYYDVVPTSIDTGFMEAMSDLRSLKEFDWTLWRVAVEGDDEKILEMVRSAAGSYIGTYIVGGRDRHFDNILIRDSQHLLHIDFTYILGAGPPLDGPPISLASEMQEAFEALGVWEKFVELCGASFASARRAAHQLLHVADLAFAKSGLGRVAVQTHLRGRGSLNVEEDDELAVDHVVRQVRDGAGSAQTWIKRLAHEFIDPAWYDLLKKGFPPAVMIMKMLDESENAEAQKLAEQLRADAANVNDDEKLEVDD